MDIFWFADALDNWFMVFGFIIFSNFIQYSPVIIRIPTMIFLGLIIGNFFGYLISKMPDTGFSIATSYGYGELLGVLFYFAFSLIIRIFLLPIKEKGETLANP